MMEEAVGHRSVQAFVKEKQKQSGLDAFAGQG
jgi:hypothetical protein